MEKYKILKENKNAESQEERYEVDMRVISDGNLTKEDLKKKFYYDDDWHEEPKEKQYKEGYLPTIFDEYIEITEEDLGKEKKVPIKITKMRKCKNCEGSGIIRRGEECDNCAGKGYIAKKMRDNGVLYTYTISCPYCVGVGYRGKYSERKCPKCKGEGEVPSYEYKNIYIPEDALLRKGTINDVLVDDEECTNHSYYLHLIKKKSSSRKK